MCPLARHGYSARRAVEIPEAGRAGAWMCMESRKPPPKEVGKTRHREKAAGATGPSAGSSCWTRKPKICSAGPREAVSPASFFFCQTGTLRLQNILNVLEFLHRAADHKQGRRVGRCFSVNRLLTVTYCSRSCAICQVTRSSLAG